MNYFCSMTLLSTIVSFSFSEDMNHSRTKELHYKWVACMWAPPSNLFEDTLHVRVHTYVSYISSPYHLSLLLHLRHEWTSNSLPRHRRI